jgi:hypothetical protein
MIRHTEDKKDYFGTIVFIVLFFLFVCSFSKNTDKPVDRAFQYELISAVHSNITALNDAQQLYYPKSLLSFTDKTIFNLFSEHFKIVTENRLINQRILILQKSLPLMKFIVLQRFYYQYHYSNTDDLPVLS